MSDQTSTSANPEASEDPSSRGFLKSLRAFFGAKQEEVTLRESLEEALEGHEEGSNTSIGEKEREMLFNVIEYGELRVNDVMVPRADIVAVPGNSSFSDLVKVFAEAAHSRMPVYRETLDDVVGMVHVKDALKVIAEEGNTDQFKLSSIRRPVLYVPASMRVIDLLAKMKTSRTHMAVVVDEYGGTDGLVTVEDMVEEIVGELEDEHDTVEEPDLVRLNSGAFDADGRLDIDELEEALGVELTPEERAEDIDTLAGLVFLMSDRVPDIGEVVKHETGHRFEVLDADPRRIRKVRIHLPRKGRLEPVDAKPSEQKASGEKPESQTGEGKKSAGKNTSQADVPASRHQEQTDEAARS